MLSPFGRHPADVAVDLGTSNVRIAVRGRGIVLDEPSAVAMHEGPRGREVVAVGTEARRMLGRTPASTRVVRPIRNGVVTDFEATEILLEKLLAKLGSAGLRGPRVLVCVSADTNEIERRAVQESARAAGAREVWLVPSLLAGMIGAGLPVRDPVASVLLDVGGGRSKAGVASLGGLVVTQTAPIAGDAMDDAIAAYLHSAHQLLVGERTAEALKLRVGCAVVPARPSQMRIRGRDVATGTPRELDVGSADLAAALVAPIAAIQETLLAALGRTPPELSGDIVDRGILICGAASALTGLDEVLRASTGLPVLHADDAAKCTINGLAALLEDAALFERVAASG